MAALVVIPLLNAAFGASRLELPLGSGSSIPYATVLPLLVALVLGEALCSRADGLERLSSRPVAWLRVGHGAGLTLIGLTTVTLSLPQLNGEIGASGVARNCLLLAGISMVAAQVLDPSLSWIAPTVVVVVSITLAGGATASTHPWTILVRPDGDLAAGITAMACFATGLLGLYLRAPQAPSRLDQT